MASSGKRFVLFAVFAALVVIVGSSWTLIRFAFVAREDAAEPVLFAVTQGQAPRRVVEDLEARGVISSAEQMLWLGRALGKWPELKVGEYEVAATMTPIEIFSILTSGISKAYSVTI